MSIRKVQMSFAAGELAPSMYGRFDDQKYQQGLARCRNFIVLPQGPATIRPGTAYVNAAKYSDKKCRLIPFTFSSDQTLAIELGDKYARFHTSGKTLLGSNGQPYEVETPYSSDDVFDIHYVQSMDIMTLVHPNYPPKELRRYGATDWRLVDVNFGAPLPAPGAPSVQYTVVASKDQTITDEERNRYTLKYRVTAVRETSTGSQQESPASGIGETKGNLYLNNATCTLSWSAVAEAERYRVYKNYKGLYCFIGETVETSFIDDNYSPDEGITPPIYDDPFFTTKGITEARVTNGGAGYTNHAIAPLPAGFCTRNNFLLGSRYKQGYDEAPYEYKNPPDWLFDYPSRDSASAAMRKVIDGGLPCIKEGERHGFVWAVCPNDAPSERGAGSGATIAYDTVTENGYTGYYNFRVTNAGAGYTGKPVYRLRYRDNGPKYKDHWYERCLFRLDVQEAPYLTVSDSTGAGAELIPVIENGVLVQVRIRAGGQGYSSPKATLVSSSGSGASIALTVGKAGDYPGAVCYYEQRRCFAGTPTRPQMVWMTRSGTESDMSHTLPSQDDNRLRFAIAAQEASRILHLTPLQQMLAMTNTTEYRVSSGGSAPMAPDAIRSEVQAQIGASNVMPVVVNSTVVYAAARGGHVRELGYNWQASGFTTGDLSIRSAHFFEETRIVDMALAKSPDPIVWAAMADGSLLGFTYLPEQAIGGWHKYTTENGAVESVTVIPEGDEDIVYLIVRRTINGQNVRYVERMHERKLEQLDDAWHVDCGGEYIGDRTTEVSGLTWLEGETVNILADGCVLPQRVVTGGKVTLTQPSSHVIVGLPITAALQTLPVAIQLQDGSFGMGHMKNVNDVYLRVHKSSGVFVGPDFENLVEYKQRTDEPYGSPPALMSKEIALSTISQWNDSGQICVRQTDPLPLTIVSLCWDLAR